MLANSTQYEQVQGGKATTGVHNTTTAVQLLHSNNVQLATLQQNIEIDTLHFNRDVESKDLKNFWQQKQKRTHQMAMITNSSGESIESTSVVSEVVDHSTELLIIDDITSPAADCGGVAPPLELLRCWLAHGCTTGLVKTSQDHSAILGTEIDQRSTASNGSTDVMCRTGVAPMNTARTHARDAHCKLIVACARVDDEAEVHPTCTATVVDSSTASSIKRTAKTTTTPQHIDHRLLRYFLPLWVEPTSSADMSRILKGAFKEWFGVQTVCDDVQKATQLAVTATIGLLSRCVAANLQTVTFRRTVAAVRAIRAVPSCNVQSVQQFGRLWFHEMCRGLRDALFNCNDKDTFDKLLLSSYNEVFFVAELVPAPLHGENEIQNDTLSSNNELDPLKTADVTLTSWTNIYSAHEEKRSYKECYITSKKKQRLLDAYVTDYVATSGTSEIVLFPSAAERLLQLCRAIELPNTNCILLGLPGSGRRTLCRLACHTTGASLFEPDSSDCSSAEAFRDFVRRVILAAVTCTGDTTGTHIDNGDSAAASGDSAPRRMHSDAVVMLLSDLQLSVSTKEVLHDINALLSCTPCA
eukprot:Lankesteria_metandrocarpae@DN10686_c0_g1_i1.p1